MFYVKSIDRNARQIVIGDTVDNVDEVHSYNSVAQAVFGLNIPIKGVSRNSDGRVSFKVYHLKLSDSVITAGDSNYVFEDGQETFDDLSFNEKCKVLAVSMDLVTAVADFLSYDTDDGVEFFEGFYCYGFLWNNDVLVDNQLKSAEIEIISNDAIGLTSTTPLKRGTGSINVRINGKHIFDFSISTDRSAKAQVEDFKESLYKEHHVRIVTE